MSLEDVAMSRVMVAIGSPCEARWLARVPIVCVVGLQAMTVPACCCWMDGTSNVHNNKNDDDTNDNQQQRIWRL